MADLEVREWIAYGMLATLFVGAAAGAFIYRQKAHWRKLRMAGDSRAKRREFERRR